MALWYFVSSSHKGLWLHSGACNLALALVLSLSQMDVTEDPVEGWIIEILIILMSYKLRWLVLWDFKRPGFQMPARSLFLQINHSCADTVSSFLGQSLDTTTLHTRSIVCLFFHHSAYLEVSVLMSHRKESRYNIKLPFKKCKLLLSPIHSIMWQVS